MTSEPRESSGPTTSSLIGPFPDAPRVLYRRNPLTQVICQLRFPTILRIDAEVPVGFQEQVRNIFPIYTAPADAPLSGLHLQFSEEMLRLLRSVGGNARAFQRQPSSFSTSDANWTITLGKESIALAATSYRRWEGFREFLDPAILALEREYQPTHYSRVGLRYRNVIRRVAFGLADEPWQNLLEHHLTGELTAPLIAPFIEGTTRQTLVRLPEFSSKVRIRHGLAVDQGEVAYVIDNDFFVEGATESSNVVPILQYFSVQAHRLFRWCISDRLHQAMEPESLV